jgi:hypothetical protein
VLIENLEFIEYEVQIRAVRAPLVSAWTAGLFQAPAIGPPPAPTSLSAIGTTESIRVAWSFPSNPVAVDFYTLYTSATSDFEDAEIVYRGRGTSFNLSGLSPDASRWIWASATAWGIESSLAGPVDAIASPLDWESLGGDGLEAAVLNSGVVTASSDVNVVFTFDGTDYQVQRTEQIRYTYDDAGTYTYSQGSASADADREYPWIDTPLYFYRGGQLVKTFTFRHLCNYGREDSNARIGTKCRSIWIAASGTEADHTFSVAIGSADFRAKWSGAQIGAGGFDPDAFDALAFDSESFGGSSGPAVYADSEYGGDLSQYTIVVTHIPSGVVARQIVALSAINAIAPFYDYGGGGGGYK